MITSKISPGLVLFLGWVASAAFQAPIILVLLILALLVWAALPRSVLDYRMILGWPDRVETKLARVLALYPAQLVADAALDVDWTKIRLTCLQKMYKVRSYCSRTVVQNFANDKLAARNFVSVQWRADFVGPNHWHVTQEGVDCNRGVLWDEWISIGSRNYQNSGLWLQTADGSHDCLNLKLSIDALLKIVTEQTPITTAMFRHRRVKYLVAQYSWASVKASIGHYWGIDADEAGDPAIGNLEIWVNVRTSQIIKGEISTYDGRCKAVTIRQAFGCFDEEIEVAAPPWLNAVPNQLGEFTVLDSRVAIVPHHS